MTPSFKFISFSWAFGCGLNLTTLSDWLNISLIIHHAAKKRAHQDERNHAHANDNVIVEGSWNIFMEAVLGPCHIDVIGKHCFLLVGPTLPCFHASLVNRDSLIIVNRLVASIEGKFFKCWSWTCTLILDCFLWAFNFLVLTREEKKRGVTAHFHFRAQRLSTLRCAIDSTHIERIHVDSIKLAPSWGQALAMSAPRGKELNEPTLVWHRLTICVSDKLVEWL